MIKAECDVCKSKKSDVFLAVDKHTYNLCKKCGTIYLSTRDINKSNDQNEETYLDHLDDYAGIINPHGTRYMAGNVDYFYDKKVNRPKGRLLEIGSGMGFLAYTLFSRDWDVSTIELSKAAVDWQNKYFKLPCQKIMIEDYNEKDFDAIALVEVVEHFYDPLKALNIINNKLVKGGMVFGTTPNTASNHWKNSEQNIYVPTDHIVLFNKENLEKLLKRAKFKDITIQYFGGGYKNDSNLMFAAIK